MRFLNRPRDYSNRPPETSIIPGVLSVIDTPSINLSFNSSLQILQADLVPVLLTPGTYGSASLIPVFTVNNLGQITSITQVPAAGGGSTYTVNNGLTPSTLTNFQWGGPLTQNTTITGTTFNIAFNNASNSLATLNLLNTGNAASLIGQSNGGAAAELITSLASTNTSEPILELYRKTSSVAANGIGGSIDFWLDNLPQIGPTPAGTPSTRLISKWTSAGLLTRTSQFEIETVQSAVLSRKLFITGDGQLGLDSYGIGTYADTPDYLLGVDSSGNVIEVTLAGGGGITSIDGDTTAAQTLSNGFGGLTPNWSSTGAGDRELNIPMASTPSVTAGLISNVAYKAFAAGSCGVVYDGNGGVISTNKIAYVQIPYSGTITGWTIGALQSGSCTITAFKDTYANFPPTTPTDNIFTIAPSLSSQQKNQDLSPSFIGVSATVTQGDWIGFIITGITSITWVNLTLLITKS